MRARSGGPRERDLLLRATAEARTALEEAVVAAAVAAERARSLTVMLEQALAVLEKSESAPAPGPAPTAKPNGKADALSPREQEVLALVAEGHSNKAIAEALYVSPNTIKTHVASLLSKLHADSRVQLAAMAARQAAV
ncbi:MAG: response regulator transcription factor [Thermomicrobiales bacterium]